MDIARKSIAAIMVMVVFAFVLGAALSDFGLAAFAVTSITLLVVVPSSISWQAQSQIREWTAEMGIIAVVASATGFGLEILGQPYWGVMTATLLAGVAAMIWLRP